jgi:hypothetical protein
MAERGVQVLTPVGDRYVLEALGREAAASGASGLGT